MTRRVLILSDPFTPPAYTPRLRFLCEYLVQAGWEIDLYTEQYESIPFAHTYPIHEVKVYRTRSLAEWILKSIWSLLTDWRNCYFSRKVRKAIEGKNYDLVLCCTFSTFPLRAAWDIANERNIPLHVDLRDLDEQVPGAQYQHHRQWWVRPFREWYRAANIRRRNSILRRATSISSVSPWHTEYISSILHRTPSTIYNGFDAKQFYWSEIKSDTFLISYIGKLYDFQDIRPIEDAVQELNLPDLRLQIIQGGIPTDEVGDLIRQSSIMIVLTNKEAKGMMTTKFYEALGCEKPVLCYPDDEGVLSAAIKATNAGIATDDKEVVKAFILDKYAEWKANGFTHQAVNQAEQKRFSRQYQTRQMEEILSRTIGMHQGHQILVDICWTLFYSNTTYDFLHIRGNKFNSLIYKLKITPVWQMIEGKDIILVSQTMDLIAKTVAEHIGAKAFHATPNKGEVLTHYTDFDIITDNMSDLPLIRRAKKATIITYNNRARWERILPPEVNVNFIETGREKY